MEQRSSAWFFFTVTALLLLFLLSSKSNLCTATNTIYKKQSLSGNQTIVSKGGTFELGFFSPGKSLNSYIGIWYKMTPKTVVWVANRDRPLKDPSSSQLKIQKDGNLVLVDQSQMLIWSTSFSTTTAHNYTVAMLLDTGNFVLRDGLNSHAMFWQSFDHPTDTWLPGARLGFNRITGENMVISSWRNSDDPGTGLYSLCRDPSGASQYVQLWNLSERYWRSGPWNGQYFDLMPEMMAHTLFNFSYVEDAKGDYFSYWYVISSVISRFTLDVSGQGRQYNWENGSQSWLPLGSQPRSQCEVYSFCGAFSVCNDRSMPVCRCMVGFEPAASGCVRKTKLKSETDVFMMLPDVRIPSHSVSLKARSAGECQAACLENCSCSAYAYDHGCLVWIGDLLDLVEAPHRESASEGGDFFIRLAVSELSSSSRGKKRSTTELIVGIIISVGVLSGLVLVLFLVYKRRRPFESSKLTEGQLIHFRYRDLLRATNNFTQKLGGGGFGSVFKGVLPNSVDIAVKRLEGFKQGEKQFGTEVRTMGIIQHVNLVRLRGFCDEGNERLLVYDYMANGSLDSHLFQQQSVILDWKTRYQIAIGTAKALAYLHEECRECIVHCDIKPENILLDAEFSPRVADFGMAKLIGRDFSRVLTTMRGTVGYLAPEWISGLPITPKVDVYSFGMMLFELISGRRNAENAKDGRFLFFPLWAAAKMNENEVISLLDRRLEGNANYEELNCICRTACWCIQDDENCRPSMGHVVQILEGVVKVSIPPIPRYLQNVMQEENDGLPW